MLSVRARLRWRCWRSDAEVAARRRVLALLFPVAVPPLPPFAARALDAPSASSQSRAECTSRRSDTLKLCSTTLNRSWVPVLLIALLPTSRTA